MTKPTIAWLPRTDSGRIVIHVRHRNPLAPTRAFALFLTAVFAVSAASGTDLTMFDVAIALALLSIFAAITGSALKRGARIWVAFDGWRITVNPFFGKPRTLDTREVVAIRLYGYRSGWAYQVRLREPDGGRTRWIGIPMSALSNTARAQDELLSRVAAASGVKTDKRTAETLAGWRVYGPGPSPPVRDVPRG